MSTDEYMEKALRTEADQAKILDRLVEFGPNAMRLDNGARGLCNDVGEVSSAVMKFIEYGRPLDRTNLLEEVGDCLWRLAQICKAGGFTLDQAMEANIRKLVVRYPDKYTDTASANRDTSAERAVLIPEAIQLFAGKVCEVCKAPATRICHDSDREFTKSEDHYFCKAHDRVTNIIK